jgi:PIN domain nuclease of toxin-antitoxin system
MRVLLDTHVLLWAKDDLTLVAESARTALQDQANHLVISVASIWELAIKISQGKLRLPFTVERWTIATLQDLRATLLTVEPNHVFALSELPPHHRDPFDRMLIAQAIQEKLYVVTADRVFKRYDIRVIDA